jgi:hypothetical protein
VRRDDADRTERILLEERVERAEPMLDLSSTAFGSEGI